MHSLSVSSASLSSRLQSLAAFLLLSLVIPVSAAPSRAFDEAWKEYQEAAKTRPPAGAGLKESIFFMRAQNHRLTRLAWDIFEGYPEDPRRWEAAVQIIKAVDGYVYDIVGDPEKDGQKAFRRDNAARSAWGAYARALYEQILSTPGVGSDIVKAGIEAYVYRLNMTPGSQLADQQAAVDEFARRFPGDPKQVSLEQHFYMVLQARDPGAAVNRLQQLLKSDNPALRAMAEGKARIETGRQVDIRFTALDGREVDLSKLKGRIVLIDFWATWCGPCIAELPNVKKVYEAYHSRGFEVVAISLDSEKDKQKLIDFCRDNKLPWPQHFDGKGWKNEFAVKYSIAAIPAMLLLDREGLVVSTNARGEKLDSEVRRLLGL